MRGVLLTALLSARSGLLLITLICAGVLGGCGGRGSRAEPADASASDGDARDAAAGSLFDCGARENFADPRCQRTSDALRGSIGAGPAFLAEPAAGVVVGSELWLAFHRDLDAGFLMSVDLDDGSRTLRSGTYDDPALGERTIAEGPPLVHPAGLALGPDGLYVLAEGGLFRIDPDTGDRALARPFDPCRFGDQPTQLVLAGFAMDESGLAYVPAVSVVAGAGVFALAADGTCAVVTWSETPGYEGRGSGPEASAALFAGLVLHDGYLYATYLNTEMLYRIDPASGDRVGVSTSYDGAPVGGGDELLAGGFLAPSGNRVYATGTGRGSVHVTEVSLDTGFRTSRPARFGPLRDAWSTNPPIFLYPGSDALILAVEESVQVFEPASGNGFTLSH